MPRWLFGGANKKCELLAVCEVAESGGGEFFDHFEAMCALWDMHVHEREVPGAVATGRMLGRDFPRTPSCAGSSRFTIRRRE